MLSWGEIIVVFFIALLLFGADKIPDFARTVGKMAGEYRRVRDSLRDELDNVKDEFDDVKEEVDKAGDEVKEQVEKIAEDTYKNIETD